MVNIILSSVILWVFSWLFVQTDNLVDEVIHFIKYKILKQENKITRSVDIWNDLKTPPLREFYLKIYRFFNHIQEFPETSYYEIKYFIQRGIHGYSNRDVWGFHHYLSYTIVGGLKRLKETKHGYPLTVLNEKYLDKHGNCTDEGDEINQKNWDNILDSMIWTFETSKRIEEDYWHYQESKKYSKKIADKYRKLHEELRNKRPHIHEEGFGYVLTKEECKKYEKGWKYFQKYFFNLWD
ncbi:MAG: hypothetical protein AABY22_10785 [Nanoarchaeota archaeon]|mgnify:CR=1 FL=1